MQHNGCLVMPVVCKGLSMLARACNSRRCKRCTRCKSRRSLLLSTTSCICYLVCCSNSACIASSQSFSSSLNLLPDGRSGRPPFSFSLSVRISTMTVLLSLATASRAAAGLISPAYPLNAPRKPLKTGGPYSMHAASCQLTTC